MKQWIFVLLIICLFTSCTTVAKKERVALSRAIYATNESIKVGRFDLARAYNEQATRLLAPPKSKVKVNAFDVPTGKVQVGSKGGIFSKEELITERHIVLPEGFDTKHVIAAKSPEFDSLLEQHEVLRKAEASNVKELGKVDREVNKVIIAKEKELAKEKKRSWFWAIFSGLGITGIIIVIVLCAIFPAAIPIVMGIITSLIGGFNSLFNIIGKWFHRKDSG